MTGHTMLFGRSLTLIQRRNNVVYPVGSSWWVYMILLQHSYDQLSFMHLVMRKLNI